MARDELRTWSWRRWGCVGILTLIGLLAVWSVALVSVAFVRGRSEQVTLHESSRELPGMTIPGSPAGGDPSGDAATVDTDGRVILDFVVGELEVLRGELGQTAKIEAHFDSHSYELTEKLETSGSRWTYRVTFEETSWFKDGGLRALLGGHYPTIRLWLPPDVPIALEGTFRMGGFHLELGGLWLTDIDLTLDQGALTVDFDTPLAAPVDRVSIHSTRGGLFVNRLGNTSPRLLEIDHATGALSLDLRGRWSRDSEVHISSTMSRAKVWLPVGPRIVGWPPGASFAKPTDSDVPPPTISMSVSELACALDLAEER